jgi:hypothetical protein
LTIIKTGANSTCIKFSMFFQFSLDFLFAGYNISHEFENLRKIFVASFFISF